MPNREPSLFHVRLTGLQRIAGIALILASAVALFAFFAQLKSLEQYAGDGYYTEPYTWLISLEKLLGAERHPRSWYSILLTPRLDEVCTDAERWLWRERSWLLIHGVAQVALGFMVAVLTFLIRRALLERVRLLTADWVSLWTFLCASAAFFFLIAGALTITLAVGIEAEYEEFHNSVAPVWRHEIGAHIHFYSSGLNNELRIIAKSLGYTSLAIAIVMIATYLRELGRTARRVSLVSLIVSAPLFLVWPVALRDVTASYEVWVGKCFSDLWLWNLLTSLYLSADLGMALWFLLIAVCVYAGLLTSRSSQALD